MLTTRYLGKDGNDVTSPISNPDSNLLDRSRWRTRDCNFGFTQLHGSPLGAWLLRQLIGVHVGTIVAKAQTANAHTEGFGELDLMDLPCPFNCFTVTTWSSWVLNWLVVESVYIGISLFGISHWYRLFF